MSAEFPAFVVGPFGKVEAKILEQPGIPVDPSTLEAAADGLERFNRDTLHLDPHDAAVRRSQMLHPAFSALAPLVVEQARFLTPSVRHEIAQITGSKPAVPGATDTEFKHGLLRRKLPTRSTVFKETTPGVHERMQLVRRLPGQES